ncbi:MAG: dipeptide ABC transporter ATP-binding protein, partial [Clostridia bacterium]|nr:dipeptide ABC transporter ATP-binding protein [Clostridia bacterium]
LIAVDDVSFQLKAGETLGIVGESGCGKTTLGRAILKLHQPTGGRIIFEGKDITDYNSKQMREIRKKMQIIFQDPYSSLPPRDTVGGILSEPVEVHKIVPKEKVKEYVLDLMDKCGLRDYYYERYPHEFSGGQRQRICIARALSVNPKLVICDEPVSALDVSIQAQIINLLKKLQQDMGLTYVFISHDLSVVKYISDKIGVMYLGSMVEFGTKEDIFSNPLHPYTKALFSAIPHPDPDVKMNRIILKGDIPSPANPPKGCRFHTRCPHAKDICKEVTPEYKDYGNGHCAACHLLG